jgi:pimeloyl-ACP methyl ester carboxylesterase
VCAAISVPTIGATIARFQKDAGHYPMLERPAEFNQHLVAMVHELEDLSPSR